MRRKKEQVSEEPAPQGPTPHEIGLKGTVEDLNEADKAAVADIAAKKAIFDAYAKKSNGGKVGWDCSNKFYAFKEAYEAAQKVPYQIHRELQKGAFEAFLEGRHENLQEILSRPEAFLDKYQNADSLVRSTLIDLAGCVPDPETLRLALVKVDEDKRQGILDDALYTLVSVDNDLSDAFYVLLKGCNRVEKVASVLLEAGAKADHDSSRTLAAAFYKRRSDTIVEMLVDNGASFDEAIKTMRDNPELYGDSADRIELLQYKKETQTTIAQLKETIEQLTVRLEKPDAAPPAPAAKTGKRLIM
jgi:hypothetical protein